MGDQIFLLYQFCIKSWHKTSQPRFQWVAIPARPAFGVCVAGAERPKRRPLRGHEVIAASEINVEHYEQ